MTELRDFLVAVTNRYNDMGDSDTILGSGDVVDAIADVLAEQGFAVVSTKGYTELCQMVTESPDLCPYCEQPLGQPHFDHDQDGFSMVTWPCNNCGARVIITNYPPPIKEDDDYDTA